MKRAGRPVSPHFAAFLDVNAEPERSTVAVEWSGPDAAAVLKPPAPADLDGAESLALRLAVPPNTDGARFDVAVSDAAGKRAVLGEVSLDGMPGSGQTVDVGLGEVEAKEGNSGESTFRLPVKVRADTTPGPDVQYRVLAKAGANTMVSDYVGSLTVQNDDGE